MPDTNPENIAYPRYYRVAEGPKRLATFVGGIAILAGSTGVRASRFLDVAPWGRPVILAVALGVAVFGAIFFGTTRSARVTLYADAIEYKSWLTRWRLLRSQIQGRQFKRHDDDGPPSLVFVPFAAEREPIELLPITEVDEIFSQWVEPLTDLDEHIDLRPADIKWPRYYGATAKKKAFAKALACSVLVGGVTGVVASLALVATPKQTAVLVAAFSAATLLGLALACRVLWARITLHVDRIERRGILTRRRMLRANIRGRLLTKKGGPPSLVLVPAKGFLPIELKPFFLVDLIFGLWVSPLEEIHL